MLGYKEIELKDLQVGAKLKAHWDGAYHKIIDVKNDEVYYEGITYDGKYKDTTKVMLECFDLAEF